MEVQSGTVLCYQAFNNWGVVNVSAGAVLRLAGGGTASGPFNVVTNGLVDWSASSYTLATGAQLNGEGLCRVGNSASLVVNGDVPAWNLDLAGTLDGTNTLTVSGVMNWTAGMMQGAGGR